MNRLQDIEGQFHLFSSSQGGRKAAVFSGYRPQHKIHNNCQTSGQHEYPNSTQVTPGETVATRVWLLSPEAYPNCLWVGREIGIFEGSLQVGTITVTCIFNKTLLGSPDAYSSVWIEPVGLNAESDSVVS